MASFCSPNNRVYTRDTYHPHRQRSKDRASESQQRSALYRNPRLFGISVDSRISNEEVGIWEV